MGRESIKLSKNFLVAPCLIVEALERGKLLEGEGEKFRVEIYGLFPYRGRKCNFSWINISGRGRFFPPLSLLFSLSLSSSFSVLIPALDQRGLNARRSEISWNNRGEFNWKVPLSAREGWRSGVQPSTSVNKRLGHDCARNWWLRKTGPAFWAD